MRHRRIEVRLECNGSFVDEQEIPEITGISEGMMGEDILTFICPECGEEHESVRVSH